MLEWADQEMQTYLQPIPPNRANPLYRENSMNAPANVNLLDYQNLEETFGSWVTGILEQADSFFGSVVDDPNAPDGTGKALGANKFMRESILDQNRALAILIADLPFEAFDPVLFQSHDMLTETTIKLVGVRLLGLDTFNKFDPLTGKLRPSLVPALSIRSMKQRHSLDPPTSVMAAIGRYTLQNTFHLDEVTVEMDLSVKIKPSTKDDAVITNMDPNKEIIESITVKFGVDNLNVNLALLMAVDQDRLRALEIGGLLRAGNILSCFASVLHELGVAGFDATVGNIRDPVLQGFISPGIDRVVSEAVEAVFLMYEPTFLRALPAIFQGPFRDIVEDEVLASDLFNPSDGACSWLMVDAGFDEYIDFRDLLLPPSDAKQVGGSGSEPYGNLGKFVRKTPVQSPLYLCPLTLSGLIV